MKIKCIFSVFLLTNFVCATHEIRMLAEALQQLIKNDGELKAMLERHKQKQQKSIEESKKIKAYEKGKIKYENIVRELQKAGIIPAGVTIDPQSQLTQGANAIVFFVKKKDDSGVLAYEAAIRVVLQGDGNVEHKTLLRDLNLVQFVHELNALEDVQLPIIVEPRGGLKIGDQVIIVYDRARGIRLDTLYEIEFAMLNVEDIEALFFSIGEQVGNLDRLFYQEKGGILCHPDSHPGNFLYDYNKEKKIGQLYWLDTAGVNIKEGVKSSFERESICLDWFYYINMPGLGSHNWREGRFEIESKLNALLTDQLNPKIKKDFLVSKYNEVIKILQKDYAALKSLGQGYVKRYPAAKHAFNKTVEKNKDYWEALAVKAKDVARRLNLGEPIFPDTIQP
jgi:hypothetical protein